MKVTLTILASITIISIVAWLFCKITNLQQRYGLLIPAMISLLFLIWNSYTGSIKPKDYFAQNRPYLEPQILITKIENGKFNYSYLIDNTGKLPAKNLRFFFKDSSSKHLIVKNPEQNELAPSGSMKIKGTLKEQDLGDYLYFELHAFYQASINGKEKDFIDKYKFFIFKDELKEGLFAYESANREEGKLEAKEILKTTVSGEQLDKIEGSVFFVFNENDQSHEEVTRFLNSETKQLVYNPFSHEIILYYKKSNNETLSLKSDVPYNDSKNHLVVVIWNKKSCSLSVDKLAEVKTNL